MLRRAAIGLSLANLCFLEAWAQLLDPSYRFFLKSPPKVTAFLAVMLWVVLVGGLGWVGLSLAQHRTRAACRSLGLAIILVMLLFALANVLGQALAFYGIVAWLGVFLALVALVSWQREVLRVTATLGLVMFPFVVVTFGQAGWFLVNPQAASAFSEEALAPPLPSRQGPTPRVLWLIFDELDQQRAFPERPPRIQLPELDRLRGQALYANNAYPPSRWTQLSMPALITGQPVSKAKPLHASEMIITLGEAGDAVRWSTQANIFSRARQAGLNTALVGCYFPYCRVLGASLTSCFWEPMAIWINRRVTLWDLFSTQVRNLSHKLLLAVHWTSPTDGTDELVEMVKKAQMNAYLSVLEETRKAAINPDLGLVLAHWPIPHIPGIYDASTDKLSLDGPNNYLDNLELVDRTVGELRRAMEAVGTWENTAVLITADHSWRTAHWGAALDPEEATVGHNEDPRVPFLLKLPGQNQAITYDPPFYSVIAQDLLLAVLQGEVSTTEGAAAWLDKYRSVDLNLSSSRSEPR